MRSVPISASVGRSSTRLSFADSRQQPFRADDRGPASAPVRASRLAHSSNRLRRRSRPCSRARSTRRDGRARIVVANVDSGAVRQIDQPAGQCAQIQSAGQAIRLLSTVSTRGCARGRGSGPRHSASGPDSGLSPYVRLRGEKLREVDWVGRCSRAWPGAAWRVPRMRRRWCSTGVELLLSPTHEATTHRRRHANTARRISR